MTLTLKNQRGALGAIQTRDGAGPDLGVVGSAPGVDLGARYTGGSGMTPRQSDLTAMRSLRDTGLLSPHAVQEIDKILAKYGGARSGNTSQAGITSTDRAAAEKTYNNRCIAQIKAAGDRMAEVQADAPYGR